MRLGAERNTAATTKQFTTTCIRCVPNLDEIALYEKEPFEYPSGMKRRLFFFFFFSLVVVFLALCFRFRLLLFSVVCERLRFLPSFAPFRVVCFCFRFAYHTHSLLLDESQESACFFLLTFSLHLCLSLVQNDLTTWHE
jgi:hypothetical protein